MKGIWLWILFNLMFQDLHHWRILKRKETLEILEPRVLWYRWPKPSPTRTFPLLLSCTQCCSTPNISWAGFHFHLLVGAPQQVLFPQRKPVVWAKVLPPTLSDQNQTTWVILWLSFPVSSVLDDNQPWWHFTTSLYSRCFSVAISPGPYDSLNLAFNAFLLGLKILGLSVLTSPLCDRFSMVHLNVILFGGEKGSQASSSTNVAYDLIQSAWATLREESRPRCRQANWG